MSQERVKAEILRALDANKHRVIAYAGTRFVGIKLAYNSIGQNPPISEPSDLLQMMWVDILGDLTKWETWTKNPYYFFTRVISKIAKELRRKTSALKIVNTRTIQFGNEHELNSVEAQEKFHLSSRSHTPSSAYAFAVEGELFEALESIQKGLGWINRMHMQGETVAYLVEQTGKTTHAIRKDLALIRKFKIQYGYMSKAN